MASRVCTVKAILSIACHLPNPVINEYQLEEQHNFLSFFFFFFPVDEAEEDVVSCLSILIKFKTRFTEKQSMFFADGSNMGISDLNCSIKESSLRASTAIWHLVIWYFQQFVIYQYFINC